MECVHASHLVARLAPKFAAGAICKGGKWVFTVHGSTARGFQVLTLHSWKEQQRTKRKALRMRKNYTPKELPE